MNRTDLLADRRETVRSFSGPPTLTELPTRQAVWVLPHDGDDRSDNRSFRVVTAELWSVENNINLANMDWADFTRSVGTDGIFRGF